MASMVLMLCIIITAELLTLSLQLNVQGSSFGTSHFPSITFADCSLSVKH